MKHINSLILILAAAGCAQVSLEPAAPSIDLSPLGCGYKWFQTGYSQNIRVKDCDADRSALRTEMMIQASAHAWEVGGMRCPAQCPPRELKDTTPWENPEPNGACLQGRVYFLTRVFLQCTGSR